jgi:hypothetical protein
VKSTNYEERIKEMTENGGEITGIMTEPVPKEACMGHLVSNLVWFVDDVA